MIRANRWVFGSASAWIAVTVVVNAQQPATSAAATTVQGEKTPQVVFERFQRAEKVMNASCSAASCHTIRPIQTASKDEQAWKTTVAAMTEKGAQIAPDDLEVLIPYLTRYHGPLPEGEGQSILLNICTMCHDLERVRSRRMTTEGWMEVLNQMIFEGAPLSDDQFPVLLTYLARNFRL